MSEIIAIVATRENRDNATSGSQKVRKNLKKVLDKRNLM